MPCLHAATMVGSVRSIRRTIANAAFVVQILKLVQHYEDLGWNCADVEQGLTLRSNAPRWPSSREGNSTYTIQARSRNTQAGCWLLRPGCQVLELKVGYLLVELTSELFQVVSADRACYERHAACQDGMRGE